MDAHSFVARNFAHLYAVGGRQRIMDTVAKMQGTVIYIWGATMSDTSNLFSGMPDIDYGQLNQYLQDTAHYRMMERLDKLKTQHPHILTRFKNIMSV